MYYKISPVIIIVLILAIAAIGILGVKISTIGKKNSTEMNQIEIETSEAEPVLDLKTNTDEENQESVIITANATTEDSEGIASITLPDGSQVRDSTATYEVKKNGNYNFKVKGVNGKTSTLTIEVNNIHEASSENPYLPTGFTHIGGEVNTGYVIQDSVGNEYVWVPVSSGKLTRNTMMDINYEEENNTASALVNSVAQNYGFYIARFESSVYEVNGQRFAASIGNRSPWVNISYIDAANVSLKSASAFGYEGYNTAIINSYAWDTTLAWIDSSIENFSTNTGYGNYSGSIRNTGTTESDIKNNICDLAGNIREWTTERYKNPSALSNNRNSENEEIVSETVNYRVVRGGSANLSRTASSHTGYKENISDPYWGFRMVLYK